MRLHRRRETGQEPEMTHMNQHELFSTYPPYLLFLLRINCQILMKKCFQLISAFCIYFLPIFFPVSSYFQMPYTMVFNDSLLLYH